VSLSGPLGYNNYMENTGEKNQSVPSGAADVSVPEGDEDELECRCKESREKTLREILLTALRDLMFWKR